MENASKALIIAGAILLSILIIGLGMFIYQQAAGAMGDTSAIDEAAINAYNAKFKNYEGIQSGSTARQLCSVVTQHNLTGAQGDVSRFVKVQDSDASSATSNGYADTTTASTANQDATNVRRNIKAGARYEITFGYDDSGRVVCIGIDEQ